MPAGHVQCGHEEMDQVAKTFMRQAEEVASAHQRIKAAQEKLADGDWIGKGANRFQQEMENSINPSLTGLQQAMEEASNVSNNISTIFHDAEDEATHTIQIIIEY